MGHKKLHREPLADDVASALLASPILEGVSAGERLKGLRAQLTETVNSIRASLENNPLAKIAAEAAAKKIGRRGAASVVVDDGGIVLLEVRYQADGKKRKWHSNLPPLGDLRAEAKNLGLDLSVLGRSRRKLADAIREARGG